MLLTFSSISLPGLKVTTFLGGTSTCSPGARIASLAGLAPFNLNIELRSRRRSSDSVSRIVLKVNSTITLVFNGVRLSYSRFVLRRSLAVTASFSRTWLTCCETIMEQCN